MIKMSKCQKIVKGLTLFLVFVTYLLQEAGPQGPRWGPGSLRAADALGI